MGFFEWLGFRNPRDAPQVPDVRDNVRDSSTVFALVTGVRVRAYSCIQPPPSEVSR